MIVAVIGLGYWGPNMVRNFLACPGVNRVLACDLDAERCEQTARRFPGLEIVADLDEALSRADAAVLATPLSTHHALGMRALDAGCHLLVEKPFTETSAQAQELIDTARCRKLTLMVDHTFLYTGAVRKMAALNQSGDLGRLLYFDSVRVNLGLFQHDTNVIWDLAPHDLSIMDHILGGAPEAVQAVGARHYYEHEDMAYLTVRYPNDLLAHIHVNWISPVKVRQILVGGSNRMLMYDDMEPSEKIKVYDKGVEIKDREQVWETLVSYRTGDMWAPRLEQAEALSLIAREFIASIKEGRRPLTDGESGLRVVRVLEAAQKSLTQGNVFVPLAD